MNFQPQPRTDLVPQHPCMSCAPTDLQGHPSTLTPQSEPGPTLIRPYQLTEQEISEHQNALPDRCLNQLQTIQLP
jgi:hypothetical protein